jgi:hypothetical protein
MSQSVLCSGSLLCPIHWWTLPHHSSCSFVDGAGGVLFLFFSLRFFFSWTRIHDRLIEWTDPHRLTHHVFFHHFSLIHLFPCFFSSPVSHRLTLITFFFITSLSFTCFPVFSRRLSLIDSLVNKLFDRRVRPTLLRSQ